MASLAVQLALLVAWAPGDKPVGLMDVLNSYAKIQEFATLKENLSQQRLLLTQTQSDGELSSKLHVR